MNVSREGRDGYLIGPITRSMLVQLQPPQFAVAVPQTNARPLVIGSWQSLAVRRAFRTFGEWKMATSNIERNPQTQPPRIVLADFIRTALEGTNDDCPAYRAATLDEAEQIVAAAIACHAGRALNASELHTVSMATLDAWLNRRAALAAALGDTQRRLASPFATFAARSA